MSASPGSAQQASATHISGSTGKSDITIGLMSAMKEEVDSLIPEIQNKTEEEHGKRIYYKGVLWGNKVVIVFSRWGKVAAAATSAILIERYNCGEIIFTGVAGGVAHGLNVGDVVVADRLVQHDMDATPIFKRWEIPLLGAKFFHVSEARREQLASAAELFLSDRIHADTTKEQLLKFGISSPKVVTGLAASGDKFFSSGEDLDRLRSDLPNVACVEMEGAAVAQVCFEHCVPFSVVRTISDGADDGAHVDFQAFVNEIATVYSHGILELALSRSLPLEN
mmetsp:Transcript_26306/g.77781  ORF Transcript_26306/g.77781 Transcript_26306/m.77781 type:complete len:280 (-) Transcript_26306:115-954(-)